MVYSSPGKNSLIFDPCKEGLDGEFGLEGGEGGYIL